MAATGDTEVTLEIRDGEGKGCDNGVKRASTERPRFSWTLKESSNKTNKKYKSRPTFTFAQGKLEEKEEPAPSIKPWHLFRFANSTDLLMLLIGCIFACGQGVLFPFLGHLLGDAVGASAPGQRAMDQFAPVLEKIGIFMIALCLSGTIWQWAFLCSAERQCARMRKAYLANVLKKDMSWFDSNSLAELPVRISVQVGDIQDALGPRFGEILLSFGQFVSGIAFAFTTGAEGWKLTLVVMIGAPFLGICGAWVAKALRQGSDVKQSGFAEAGAVVEEALTGMRTVASFGGENLTVERFQLAVGPAKRAGILMGLNMGAASGTMFGTFTLMYALAFWFASNYLQESGADIVQVFFCVLIGLSALQKLGDPLLKWSTALASGAQMFRVLDHKSSIEPNEDETTTGKEGGTIQEVSFEKVEFCYPTRLDMQILMGVSLRIERGRKVAFVGESGSGKSTLVQLLLRFYDPKGGQVAVNGEDLRGLSLNWWRRQLGYVGQEPVLFATSVRKNITNGDRSVPEERIIKAIKDAQAYDFLMRLPKKINTSVGVGGGQMSGGQKQRIAIARALLRTPQILILDEATSALDNESERLVQITIDKLQEDQAAGLTTVSVAHRLSTIRNSDTIFFLKLGVVAEQGSHDELMASEGLYYQLVRSQETEAPRQESEAPAVSEQPLEDAGLTPRGSVLMEALSLGTAAMSGSSNVFSIETSLASLALSGNARRSSARRASSESASALASKRPPTRRSLESCRSSCVETEKERETKRMAEIGVVSIPKRRLLRISRPEWWLYPLALAGCIAAGGATPVMGLMLSSMTEAFYLYTGDQLKAAVNKGCLGFVGLCFATFFGEIMKWGFFSYIQEHLAARLRCMCFSSLVRQEMGFFDNPANSAQGLAGLIERQVKDVAQVTGIAFGNVVAGICALVVSLMLAFSGSWRLTLALVAVFPVIAFTLTIAMAAANMGSSASAYSHAGALLSESILNIRTVRSLQCEQHRVDAFWKVIWRAARQNSYWGAVKSGAVYGFSNALINILYIVGFAIGGLLIDQGFITQAGMFQCIFCILFGTIGLSTATAFSPDAIRAKLACYDLFRLVDRKSAVNAVEPSGKHRSLGDGTIAFEAVEFVYPHRPDQLVLQGLSFSVAAGQSVALVGPSGCGKSTVIQMLMRFYDASCGQVLVGGVPLKQFDVAWWRQQMSLVGQEPVLFNMTLEDNIIYGKPEATHEEVMAAARGANMDFALNGQFLWEDYVGVKGSRLSGGQKQRCAIARAMIRDPKILLLDEATSALDSKSEREVQQALDTAQAGRTTFTIAHRLSTIMNSDKIIVIVEGKLAEEGTHTELLGMDGVYANLWGKSDPKKH